MTDAILHTKIDPASVGICRILRMSTPVFSSEQAKAITAFVSGTHRKLGVNCTIKLLDEYTLTKIIGILKLIIHEDRLTKMIEKYPSGDCGVTLYTMVEIFSSDRVPLSIMNRYIAYREGNHVEYLSQHRTFIRCQQCGVDSICASVLPYTPVCSFCNEDAGLMIEITEGVIPPWIDTSDYWY